MATKKHNLTTHKDRITGKAGTDLFIGTKGELGNNDMLNGGAGFDTITAVVSGKYLAPVMKNIEKGVFTHAGNSQLEIRLAHAEKMRNITLKDLHSEVVVRTAAALNTLTVTNLDGHDVDVFGVDMSKSLTQHLSANNVHNAAIEYHALGNLQPHTLDVSLRASDIYVHGDISAIELAVHSNGKTPSTLSYAADASLESIQKVTIDGNADLNLNISQTTAFRSMISFNAANLKGDLNTQLESDKLASVQSGSGNDMFAIYELGGTTSEKAQINMGAGNDEVYTTYLVLDQARMVLDGGAGLDTVHYIGQDSGQLSAFAKFEILTLESLSGTYTLDSDWKKVQFFGATTSADQVTIAGGTSLATIVGSTDNDYIDISDLGGTAAHKAQVRLGTGDDMVRTSQLSLDSTTQRIDGGKGHDGFAIWGHVDNVGALFKNFEYAYMYNMAGAYDFAGSGVSGIVFGSIPTGAMTIKGLASGSLVQILATQTTIMTVNINDADSSNTEGFTLDLEGTADFGNSTFGLIAPHLSELTIQSQTNAHTMYITEVGDDADLATLNITGNAKLTLLASNGSTSFIDEINITNTAGADLLGLLDGTKALYSGGVDINGGAGADVLVGGVGADTISTGAGNDTIYGSLGIDSIDLSGGGLDMLIFRDFSESAYSSGDNITGFNIFTGIDISDLVSSVSFGGNVASNNAGISTLSTNHSVGFFNTGNHTLYVDINHDGALTSGQDMEFHLTGLNSFSGGSLIG